ncbi:MAG: hypothetical protein DWQ47_17770 [Acidobacteria bacterium]|nr:MAG: hypothetical protein DWQ32_05170 [Acidobacteriota bacterium]REK02119.1 MAG: hypothetical protein DWQ38_06985 [Acidobacteriota bacterium]REK14079.1 MAG: hypothetical protein DWQ43_10860 [Acidobacteriota bacterium]REK42074.1 MAG: hypothetical protein DWQ47_17770 [Acidobacteriota bacterium]
MLTNSFPRKMQELVNSELEIGERVVWSGMPRPAFFTPSSTGAFLFGIPWTAFAVFWTVMAGAGTWFTTGFSVFSLFPLFGIPFILIGFGMLSAPVFSYTRSRKTAYVITDRRAISFEGGRSTVIRSFPPEKLTSIYRNEKRNGFGDVIIDYKQWRDSDGDRQSEQLGFMRIPNARDVERLLKDLGRRAKRMEIQRKPEDDGSIYSWR